MKWRLHKVKSFLCICIVAGAVTHTATGAPIVVTPGSVAKYVYLPKAAATAGGGGGGTAEAMLALNREALTICITTSQTVLIPTNFRGMIQAIVVGGGGGGGSPGGDSTGNIYTVPGFGDNGYKGADGTATVLTINGVSITANGGIGGNGGQGIRGFAANGNQMALGGDGGAGGAGGQGGGSWHNTHPTSTASVYQSFNAAVGGHIYTSGASSSYTSVGWPASVNARWTKLLGPPSSGLGAPAGLTGSHRSVLAYNTSNSAVVRSGTVYEEAIPKGASCLGAKAAQTPFLGVSEINVGSGSGGAGGIPYWLPGDATVGGGGGGGSGELVTREFQYTGGPAIVTIGVGGARGADANLNSPSYRGASGGDGIVVLRLIPQ